MILVILFLVCCLYIWRVMTYTMRKSVKPLAFVRNIEPPLSIIELANFEQISRDHQLNIDERHLLYQIILQYRDMSTLDIMRQFSLMRITPQTKLRVYTTIYEHTADPREQQWLREQLYPPRPPPPPRPSPRPPTPAPIRLVRVVDPFTDVPPSSLENILIHSGVSHRELENQPALWELARLNNRKKRHETFYDKEENVMHVGSKLTRVGRQLIDKYGSQLPTEYNVEDLFVRSKHRAHLEAALHRILTKDVMPYDYKDPFLLKDVYAAVITFIYSNPPDKRNIMLNILVEDLERKHGKCSTGHLEALITCVQGFQDCVLSIGEENEIYSKMAHFMSKKLQTAPENVVDSLTSTNPDPLIEYMKVHKSELQKEMEEQYKGVLNSAQVQQYLSKAMNQYANVTNVF